MLGVFASLACCICLHPCQHEANLSVQHTTYGCGGASSSVTRVKTHTNGGHQCLQNHHPASQRQALRGLGIADNFQNTNGGANSAVCVMGSTPLPWCLCVGVGKPPLGVAAGTRTHTFAGMNWDEMPKFAHSSAVERPNSSLRKLKPGPWNPAPTKEAWLACYCANLICFRAV